jgi:hypothetical protein
MYVINECEDGIVRLQPSQAGPDDLINSADGTTYTPIARLSGMSMQTTQQG